jgi:hypothetical protein
VQSHHCSESPLKSLVEYKISNLQRANLSGGFDAHHLRNAKAKGKQLGRPRHIVDGHRVAGLRAQGVGWKKISRAMGIGVGTLYRLAREGSKTREKVFWTRPRPLLERGIAAAADRF